MSIGAATAKELAMLGANLEVRSGLGAVTLKELAQICASKGSMLTISSSLVGAATAKEIAQIATGSVTFIIE